MWGGNVNGPPAGSGKDPPRGEYRVVERVAYAHPVRDHQAYFAPKGGSQYEQRQPPPIPPHPVASGQQAAAGFQAGFKSGHQQPGIGYPYYQGGGGPTPTSSSSSTTTVRGPPRVRRGDHNSDVVLYDPSESVVVSQKVKSLKFSFTNWLRSASNDQQKIVTRSTLT
jgi:hypothetical protein